MKGDTRFRRLAESGIVGIAIADVNGRVVEANHACLALFGYTRAELDAGKISWEDMTPGDLRDVNARATETLLLTGAAKPWETAILRRDGERIPVMIGVAASEPPNLIMFFLDLRERIRAEEALRASEAQLRQAQKMDAIGQLAGGVAHDFNNLLSVILSYGELILDETTETDPLREDLQEIIKAARRATDLTRQLLMFSRQQVLTPRIVNLDDMLRGTERMLRRVVGEMIDLVRITSGTLGRVFVDVGSIEQIVMNLVLNARDALPKGGRITIETRNVILDDAFARTHPAVTPGPHVMLSVSDDGVGMTPDVMARIFEPFFTTKPKDRGTGLGLSTVFGLVAQSGGTIDVTSEPGRGTTFRIHLPAVSAVGSDPDDLGHPSIIPRGHETILLVEDEDIVRRVAAGILRRAGYTVFEAGDPTQALAAMEAIGGTIHLLLTDVVLPHMSGVELAARITQARSSTKVMFMSGYAPDAVDRRELADPAVRFVQKPFTPRVLTTMVRDLLDGRAR